MTPKKPRREPKTISFKLPGSWSWLDGALQQYAEKQSEQTGSRADISAAIRKLLTQALKTEGIRKPKE